MIASNAETNVNHCIIFAIAAVWDKKEQEDFGLIVAESIKTELFDPAKRWALEEYLKELKDATRN